MSMSQEEIESLMNGLDIAEDDASEVASGDITVEDIPAEDVPPVEQATEEPIVQEKEEVIPAEQETATVDNDSIDELINSLDESESSEPQEESVQPDDIDELLASIDSQDEDINEDVDSSDIDDLIASLDSVTEEKIAEIENTTETPAPTPIEEPVPTPAPTPEPVEESKPKATQDNNDFVEEKIQSGIFPLPADDESKVVAQLTSVAEDSEEKATKIFDVLSYILDENAEIQGSVGKISKFLEEQEKVLETLNAKFPNVDVFSENLKMLTDIKEEPTKINDILSKENNELFSAMELMQYHDINRQKIERVMSVIRKLSTYLNNIFEDDNSHKEIVVAKHIAGDSTEDLLADDDLDALIAEFGN